MTEKLNDFGRGVPGVLSTPTVEPHRTLDEREQAILKECDSEHDPLMLEALAIFNARVTGFYPSTACRDLRPHIRKGRNKRW